MVEPNYKYLLIAILFALGFITECASQTVLDSLLIEQVKATRGICREVKDLKQTLEKEVLHSIKIDSINNIAILESNNAIADSISKISQQQSSIPDDSSGSNWFSFFTEVFGALIGASAAIWLFYRQIKSDAKKHELLEENNNKVKIEYLNLQVISCVTTCKDIIFQMNNAELEIARNPLIIPYLGQVPLQEIERLSSLLGNENYFHAFVDVFKNRENKIQEFQKILYAVSFLLEQSKEINEGYDRMRDLHNERLKMYGDLQEETSFKLFSLGLKHRQIKTEKSQAIYEFIHNVFGNYTEGLQIDENKRSLEYYHESFTNPFQKGIAEKFIDYTEFEHVTFDLKKLSNLFQRMKISMKDYKNSISTVSKKFKEVTNLLDEKQKLFIE